jgi:hypothetical protein
MSALAYDDWKTTDTEGEAREAEAETFADLRTELLTRPALIMESLGELPASFAALVLDGDALAAQAAILAARDRYADWLIEHTVGGSMQAVERLLLVYAS